MSLLDKISQCTRCIDHRLVSSDRLNTNQKPYVSFEVERKWKPNNVNVLFIAESPPWSGYFYDPYGKPTGSTGLRREVLRYLRLKSLEEFRDNGYFLIDTIKCRLSKSTSLRAPLNLTKISKTCAKQFLHKEIVELRPKTIFILGKTAKEALQELPEFEELEKHRITDVFDENLSGYRVILSVFPGGQTRMHADKIDRAFKRIRKY